VLGGIDAPVCLCDVCAYMHTFVCVFVGRMIEKVVHAFQLDFLG